MLSEEIGISESTVRRDLQALDEKKYIVKVRGGATAVGSERFDFSEPSVEAKEDKFREEKDAIAKYAAETIRKNDFVLYRRRNHHRAHDRLHHRKIRDLRYQRL